MKDRDPSVRTVFDAILASLAKASDYNSNDMVAPAVVLWTDKDRQWEPLADRLRETLPHFLTLGDYEPRSFAPPRMTGPASWWRGITGCTVPGADWAKGRNSIAVPLSLTIPFLLLLASHNGLGCSRRWRRWNGY